MTWAELHLSARLKGILCFDHSPSSRSQVISRYRLPPAANHNPDPEFSCKFMAVIIDLADNNNAGRTSTGKSYELLRSSVPVSNSYVSRTRKIYRGFVKTLMFILYSVVKMIKLF